MTPANETTTDTIGKRHYTPSTPAQIEDHAIQLHREFVSIVREEIGMNEQFANDIAAAMVRGMRKRYGGQTLGSKGSIYVPSLGHGQRNAAIRAKFIGTNSAELCKEYGISRSRLYQIAAEKP